MKEGELVLIDYTGRTDGNIFDTTREDDAEEFDYDRGDAEYEPVPVLIGREYVLEGLEDAVSDMEVGASKTVEIPPEKGYGKRTADDIERYSEREFRKQDVQVAPGEEVVIGDRRGKVVSAASGRIRIDFNHPLAGKTLEYEVEVLEKIEDDEEKARRIFKHHVGEEGVRFEDGKVIVPSTTEHEDHEHDIPEELKEKLREDIQLATELEPEFEE